LSNFSQSLYLLLEKRLKGNSYFLNVAKIIIGGMGQVGYNLALALSREGHNLLVIEKDQNQIEQMDTIDAMVIHGNAASMDVWDQQQLEKADHFIAVTGSDEVNMVACGIAKSKGCRTIARIQNADYINEPVSINRFKTIGVDVGICPELVAAVQMAHLIASSALLNSKKYAKGRVHVLDAKITHKSQVLDKKIMDIDLPKACNIGTIFRSTDVLIPRGKDRLLVNDFVQVLIGDLEHTPTIKAMFGSEVKTLSGSKRVQKIMISGASGTGIALARMLLARGMSVVMLEADEQKCIDVSEMLPKAIVLKGSGSDLDTLKSEEINEIDIYIAATVREEDNIMSALLAKQGGATTVMAIINSTDVKDKLESIGIDMLINPKEEMVSSALKFTMAKALVNVDITSRGDAQIIELRVPPKSNLVGKEVKSIGIFKRNALIGAIIRKDKVVIPRGDTSVEANDHLLIFTKTQNIRKLSKLVRKG
jgi:trk system potassium uptake protein TrkA